MNIMTEYVDNHSKQNQDVELSCQQSISEDKQRVMLKEIISKLRSRPRSSKSYTNRSVFKYHHKELFSRRLNEIYQSDLNPDLCGDESEVLASS